MSSAGTPSLAPLTGNQIRSFLAAWGGWTLDGMDSFIYALVLVPALKELLPRAGMANTPANIGFYGGRLVALFLVGWGLALLCCPVGDRFGRVRTLTFTIVCYSLFTFLGALATTTSPSYIAGTRRSWRSIRSSTEPSAESSTFRRYPY